MTDFEEYGLDSGNGLYNFLDKLLNVKDVSGIESSQNVIHLPEYTTANWKAEKGQVRINCKLNIKEIIEKGTGLEAIANGPGDKTRPYSFLLNNMAELVDVVATLRKQEAYRK